MDIKNEIVRIGDAIIKSSADPSKDGKRHRWTAMCEAASLLSCRSEEIADAVSDLIEGIATAHQSHDLPKLVVLAMAARVCTIFLREGACHPGTRNLVYLRTLNRLAVPLGDAMKRAGIILCEVDGFSRKAPDESRRDVN